MQTIHARHNPAGQVEAASRYSQAVETGAGLRWLHLSGQIGLLPDGTLAPDQHEQAFSNLLGLLREARMDVGHLVRVNTYVTSADQVAAFRVARDRALGDARPASTLVVVAALVSPELVVEIEAVAAAPA